MSKSNFCIFINPTVRAVLEGGPSFDVIGQVIVTRALNGEWLIDDIDLLDIENISFMGKDIPEENTNKFLKNFREIGIDIGNLGYLQLEEYVQFSDVRQFVEQETGLKLP